MSNERELDIIIIGGSCGGLACAHALLKTGLCKITVLERASSISEAGAVREPFITYETDNSPVLFIQCLHQLPLSGHLIPYMSPHMTAKHMRCCHYRHTASMEALRMTCSCPHLWPENA